MGGMSFQCPLCPTAKSFWTLSQRSLRDHLRDKHGLKGVEIEGSGPATKIISPLIIIGGKIHVVKKPFKFDSVRPWLRRCEEINEGE